MKSKRQAGSGELPPMLQAYFQMRERQTAILAWQMGEWFEFYGEDAKIVGEVCGIALGRRGSLPNGDPLTMCSVPADLRFRSIDGRMVIPLTPTHYYFGQIVEAGHALAVAIHQNGRDGRDGWRIAATFNPADFSPVRSLQRVAS